MCLTQWGIWWQRPGDLTARAEMRSPKFIAIFCLFALGAGCGSHPKIRKLRASSVIVAFGDSLTFGTGASPGESYPSVLATMIEGRVVNAGVPGEDSAAGLARLPGVLEDERPDLVLLCHGGNDMLRGQDSSITLANLNAMIALVKNAGADVILIGVPRPALRLKVAPFYQKIADQQDIPCEADAVSGILSAPDLTSDPAHPNASGYRRLAEVLRSSISDSQ